ncbi:glycosyltransferase family 4 protein [Geminisphaera colitermitum]|uniref:glycosyltransferase family 4 protein n=1 Tax=Geminisphaera colitermitum TaxID=1148786 RepID=UPI0012FEEE08|nr:glycosyltransferase family 4 protein [Geminisphaera colitermitum]
MNSNKLMVLASGLSYPPNEGLHEQFLQTLENLIKFKESGGLIMDLIVVSKAAEDFDKETFCSKFPQVDSLHVIICRLKYPFLMAKCFIFPMLFFSSVLGERGNYAYVYIEGIPLAPLIRYFGHCSIIMSGLDAWSLRQRRLSRKSRGMRKFFLYVYAMFSLWVEKKFYKKATCVHLVSPVDARYYRRVLGISNIAVIPVSVQDERRREHSAAGNYVVFWGDIRVRYIRAGLDLLLNDVWPSISECMPNVSLIALTRMIPDMGMTGDGQRNVRFLEWCDDIDTLLSNARIILLPDMAGTGLKNRTIRALASGRPVIGSRFALEGIPVKAGIDAFLAKNKMEFIEKIKLLLNDTALADAMGQSARKFVSDNYSSMSVNQQWMDLFSRIF